MSLLKVDKLNVFYGDLHVLFDICFEVYQGEVISIVGANASGKSTGKAMIPEGAAAWMECEVESSKEIKGYCLFMGRVVNQNDTGKPPLVWHKDGFCKIAPV